MKETELVPVKNNLFSNLKEWIRSKIDKNYILTSNSPQSLFKNKKLIIRTLKANPSFLESLSDEIIFQNDDIFIKEAIESGYYISMDSRFKSRIDFLSKYIDISGEIPSLYALDYSVFENQQFKEKVLEKAKREQFLIPQGVPEFLREDKDLALIYYKNLLVNNENSVDLEKRLERGSILTSNLIGDISFLKEFINLCDTSNVDKQKLLDIIMAIPEDSTTLRNNPQAINLIFNELQPEDLRRFFDNIQVSSEELEEFFKNDFTGNLAELGKIYEKNPIAIDTMSGELLGKGIPTFKMQEYAGDKKFQKKLLSLSPFKYKVFEKISNRNLSKTDRWNRLDSRTLDNLSDGYYDELLNDIFQQAQNGNKITEEELDTLANLFSSRVTGPQVSKDLRFQPQTNNVFNITQRNELKYYDKIRETVCSIAINNPELEENDEVKKFDKYLQYFKSLEPIDRIKIAITEKSFGMNLEDATIIMQNFGSNINNFDSIDENNKDVIEQIKAICNILNCNDIETLQEVGQSIDFVNLDLNQSTLLFDDAKKVFENDLKKDLYSPRDEDYMYTCEGIKIYRAPIEFESITKFSSEEPDKSKWENSYSGFDGKKNFRRKSCMSFTNGELLNPTEDGFITFGIGRKIKDFQFGGMYPGDAHTNMSADPVYWMDEELSTYSGKEDFVSETLGAYDEVIVDTLATDDSLDSNKKLMPEYMIYYQKTSDITEEDRDNDINWQNAIKAAKEFGIPIVVADCEAIRQNELRKIREGIEQDSRDYKSVKRLVAQIRHYTDRYRDDKTKQVPYEISELISKEQLAEKEEFLEKNKPQNNFDIRKYRKAELSPIIEENTAFLEGVGVVER